MLKIFKPSLSPDFDAAIWRTQPAAFETNCLAYALGCPEMGYAIPGSLAREDNTPFPAEDITIPYVTEFLLDDGLEKITEEEALAGNVPVIAIKIRPGHDICSMRKNGEVWTYKSTDALISYDDDCRLITNPRLAPSYLCNQFAGYFAIPENGILYWPRLKIADDPANALN